MGDYPTKPTNGTPKCHYNASRVVVKVTKIGEIAKGTEKSLEKALHVAPTVVAFQVGSAFELYKAGILKDCGTSLGTHPMEVMGFSSEGKTPYWIVKNSWGGNWGMQGYAFVEKDIGACGLDSTTFEFPESVVVNSI